MSKARVIGACSAGSTIYHCNVNLNTAGGTKKQGTPFQLDRRTFQHSAVKRIATGDKRDYIFTMNQIGGIGRVGRYPRDGIRPRAPYRYNEDVQNALTCNYDPSNTNYNAFVYGSYIILPVSCDPSTIHLITLNSTSTLNTIVFPNVTYLPNGPTNGHSGYVFKLQSSVPVGLQFHINDTSCSTLHTNTLLVSTVGSTHIEVNPSNLSINGTVCTTPINNIIYNNITYPIVAYDQQTNLLTIIIDGILQPTVFNGSLQCI